MDKKAQLGFIEFKFLLIGLVVGLVIALGFIFLAKSGNLPGKEFLCN